jgi:TetR/AcrR family fatty acid metabolism transcriptional regulator
MARRAPDALKDVIRDFRRDQILDTARRLFGERGTTEVSMDEIATEAGVARSTVYVYFANRDELLRACLQSMYDAMLGTIATITEVDATPPERLRDLIVGLLERIDESPAFFRLAMATQATESAAGSAAVGGALMLIGLDMIRLMEDLLCAGVASGAFRSDLDAERTVTLIGQQIYGALSVRAGEPEPRPAGEAADDICQFILRGIENRGQT